uniref:Uncharacterized protein n=1 Tax=Anguilla anguilla TaxID=7936 RepID=A0A0E9XTV0_ANGAN
MQNVPTLNCINLITHRYYFELSR